MTTGALAFGRATPAVSVIFSVPVARTFLVVAFRVADSVRLLVHSSTVRLPVVVAAAQPALPAYLTDTAPEPVGLTIAVYAPEALVVAATVAVLPPAIGYVTWTAVEAIGVTRVPDDWV